MTNFCLAYKNELTTEWAERTGNMAGGWIRVSDFEDFTSIKRLFDARKVDYPNSALAIFPNKANDEIAWYDRKPWYIHNRHILVADAPITSNLSGLINARESDWF
jgi:hypothetical protein